MILCSYLPHIEINDFFFNAVEIYTWAVLTSNVNTAAISLPTIELFKLVTIQN